MRIAFDRRIGDRVPLTCEEDIPLVQMADRADEEASLLAAAEVLDVRSNLVEQASGDAQVDGPGQRAGREAASVLDPTVAEAGKKASRPPGPGPHERSAVNPVSQSWTARTGS